MCAYLQRVSVQLLRKIVIYDNTDEIEKNYCAVYNKKDTKTFPRVYGKRVEWWYQMVGAGEAGVMVNGTKP